MTEADFHEVYRRNKDLLYRFARRMTGSAMAAEDVVQDSFLALWRNPSAYVPDRGSLRSFLIGVTRNLALQRLRGEPRHEELHEDSAIGGATDFAGLERAEIVGRAVAALPPLQREALILAEYEEMSLEEIGRATQADLYRARENLRRLLAPLLDAKGTVHGTNK